MKKLDKIFKMKITSTTWMIPCFLLIISLNTGIAQKKELFDHDYLILHKGKSMIILNSGIPYVAMGEYSFGISNRVSVGVLYGYTPIVLGYGLRIKAILAKPDEDLRIFLKVPMIYYPHAKNLGGDPWVLAWPTLSIEKKLHDGARLWTGIGVLGASCVDILLGEKRESVDVLGGSEQGNANKKMMSAIWNTIQVGYSKPISPRLSWTVEAAPVLHGLKLAGDEWIAGPPVILTVGVSYSL